jgi:hypothetical protein
MSIDHAYICGVNLRNTITNTVAYGNYEPSVNLKDIIHVKEHPSECTKRVGTDSDFIFMATMLLREVSRRHDDLTTMQHLGILHLDISIDHSDINQLITMLNGTLPDKLEHGTIYVINVHMHLISTDFYHETSIVISGKNHTLEYFDSSRPQVFQSFYAQLRQLTFKNLDILFVPKNKAQIQNASCGFWALYYIQRRIQGIEASEFSTWFNTKQRSVNIRKDISPRMVILADVIIQCWYKTCPDKLHLDISDITTDEQKQNVGIISEIICNCLELPLTQNLKSSWEQFSSQPYFPSKKQKTKKQ